MSAVACPRPAKVQLQQGVIKLMMAFFDSLLGQSNFAIKLLDNDTLLDLPVTQNQVNIRVLQRVLQRLGWQRRFDSFLPVS